MSLYLARDVPLAYVSKGLEPRRLVVLSPAMGDILFLESGIGEAPLERYAHLFRPADLNSAERVVKRLREENGLTVLLGGDIVDGSLLEDMPRKYKCINVIAIEDKKIVVDSCRELDQVEATQLRHKASTSPFNYSFSTAIDRVTRNIEVKFSVRNTSKDHDSYFEMPIRRAGDSKGTHQAYSICVAKPINSNSSPINLSVVERRVFGRVLKPSAH